jgi:hypothetical protein
MLYCLATHRQGLVPLMVGATALYAVALETLPPSPAVFIGCMGSVSALLLAGSLVLALRGAAATERSLL